MAVAMAKSHDHEPVVLARGEVGLKKAPWTEPVKATALIAPLVISNLHTVGEN